jgi:hypothetical protein
MSGFDWIPPTRFVFVFALAGIVELICAASLAHAEPPKIEYLDRTGVERGTEQTIKATGTFTTWPPQVWTDRPGLQITPGETSGELKVTATIDTPPGVHWFRLHNAEGATPLQTLVVSTISEALEVEPNNTPKEAADVSLPMTVNGRLHERGDVDTVAIQAEAGQTVVAAVDANRLFGSPMDGILQICTPQGTVLAQNNDARGLDPLLAYRVPKTGKYLVRVFAFPETPNGNIAFSGGPNYVYRLTITTQGFLDYALPLAVRKGSASSSLAGGWNVGDANTPLTAIAREDEVATLFRPDLAGTVEVPVVAENAMLLALGPASEPPLVTIPLAASGCIAQPGELHAVRFQAKAKQRLRIQVAAHKIGYDLDPYLRVYGVDGAVLKEIDDVGEDQDDIDLELAIPADGEYRAEITSAHESGGPRQVYRLLIEEDAPNLQLTLEKGEFALKPDSAEPLKVVVKVERARGLEGDIVIAAADLPAGVTAEPVTSEGKGESAKSVTLLLKATAEAKSGPFRITGNLTGKVPLARVARYNASGSSLGQSQVWLTVAPPAKTEPAPPAAP